MLTGTQFISNTASANGGGAAAYGAAVTLNGGLFQNNASTGGMSGGLYAASTLALTGTQFISNTASANGGGAAAFGAATLNGGLFQNNRPGGGRPGGGKGGGRALTPEQQLERATAGKSPRPDDKNGAPQKPVKAPLPKEVIVDESITVRDLATLMQRSPIDLIKILMQYGIMAPITHTIDHDTAVILGEELGVAVNWPEVDQAEDENAVEESGGVSERPRTRTLVHKVLAEEDPERMVDRPPVVAVLGHVDHGRNSTLLPRISLCVPPR